MRKLTCALLCLLMILSIAFCLTGCKSRTDEMAGLEVHTDKQINKMKKSLNTLMKRIKKVSRSFSQRVHKRISKI